MVLHGRVLSCLPSRLRAWRLVTCCRSIRDFSLMGWASSTYSSPTYNTYHLCTYILHLLFRHGATRGNAHRNGEPLHSHHQSRMSVSLKPSPELHLTYNSQELEYLTDAGIITPQTLSDLLQRMPQQTPLHAPISVGAVPTPQSQAGTIQPPPTTALNNMNLQNNNGYGQQNNGYDEKRDNSYYQPQPAAAAPPAYGAPPGPPPQANYPPLAQATALYPYNSNDAGDLELQPNDHITVTEYMNAEWWKGKSSRTGQVGIFPRSYVKVDEKAPPASTTNNYGNAPLEVSGELRYSVPRPLAELC